MTVYSKQLIIFDLDGTLAPSKSPLEPDMATLIMRLLERKKVAVISGGGYPQFHTQFLNSLPGSSENYANLLILPTSGTQLYVWKGTWVQQYAEHLTELEKQKITSTINSVLRQSGYEEPKQVYGEIIEDRGSQVTFSALGQKAPLELKLKWDPDQQKRHAIVALAQPRMPEFDIRIGGTTSIDITRRGVNKAYGIRKLEEYLNIHVDDMVFVGDALYQGGNDYPARATSIDCIQVSGPEETKKLIASWLD